MITTVLFTWLTTIWNRAVTVGVRPQSDDVDDLRRRKVLLIVHYMFLFFGPLSNVLLFLASSMARPAALTAAVAGGPTVVSLLVLCAIPGGGLILRVSSFTLCCITLVSPSLVSLLAGGVLNTGFVSQLVYVSPLVWLCTTRRLRGALVLLALATTAVHVVFASKIYHEFVEVRQVAPEMSTTTKCWHWWYHLLQLQVISFALYAYALKKAMEKVATLNAVLLKLEEISSKLVTLDVEQIEPLPRSALQSTVSSEDHH